MRCSELLVETPPLSPHRPSLPVDERHDEQDAAPCLGTHHTQPHYYNHHVYTVSSMLEYVSIIYFTLNKRLIVLYISYHDDEEVEDIHPAQSALDQGNKVLKDRE